MPLDIAILRLIAAAPLGLSAAACVALSPPPRPPYSTVQRTLRCLLREGYLVRHSRYLYALHPLHGPRLLAVAQALDDLYAAGTVVRDAQHRYTLARYG